MAQGTLSLQMENLSRRHKRRYCGCERGSRMAAREALSSRQGIRRDPREIASRWHAGLYHGSRKMPIIAADSILQWEGETISRRHERGCVLSGSGRAYHGVTRDSLCLMAAGEPITAARVIRYLSCHEGRLYHCGKRASVSIVAASTAARDRVPGGLWSCPGLVCGHLLGLRSLSGSWSVVMS